MDRGPHRSLIVAVLLATASAVAAQNPPSPEPTPPAIPHETVTRDTLARVLVLDEMFAVGPSALAPRVVLEEGQVYRVEIQPAAALFTVRSARRPSLPPLFLVPLEGGGPVGATQTAAFLMVPRASEEYRFALAAVGTEPVRLRVWTDPREMSRYARMRAATRGIPSAGFSVRAVYVGPFVRPNLSPGSSGARGNASASGVEACFGVVPRGPWSSGALGGCVLAVGRLQRPDSAGALWYIGTEPKIELTERGAAVELSLTLTVGMASSDDIEKGASSTDYVFYALGGQMETRLVGRHWYVEAEADLASARESDGFLSGTGKGRFVPRFGAGMQYRF